MEISISSFTFTLLGVCLFSLPSALIIGSANTDRSRTEQTPSTEQVEKNQEEEVQTGQG